VCRSGQGGQRSQREWHWFEVFRLVAVCVGCGLCMYSVLLGSVDVWLAGVGIGVSRVALVRGVCEVSVGLGCLVMWLVGVSVLEY